MFYKLPPERVLVVCDDVSLPVGKLRLRRNGTAGGHNGLRSIIGQLHSDQFPRLKIGVGAEAPPGLRHGRLGAGPASPRRTAKPSTPPSTAPSTPWSACSPRASTRP